ncbi:MAG: 30S ribosomal protein S20 [Ignavibacteria bacterium CG2_30_36_16]|nr:30S ribosomal protein S20 [Ignavibacteria bacterium]OIP62124.1 MAG: 30S ribosomal protein S20 [Ignavibacteria bacterium CG2_30_36_16]PJB01932.1 MAG: 30S ribosomal protein S20 [Ignavibacteria bacterium CG_4_9_14_3_um_filter_36_18]
MANHKSAKKRIKTSEKKRIRNKGGESKIKTLVKKVMATTEKTDAEKTYREAVAFLDKNVSKGILHKNTASRKKSALTKHINSLTSAPVAE